MPIQGIGPCISAQHNFKATIPINYNVNGAPWSCVVHNMRNHMRQPVPFLTMCCCLGIFPTKLCYL